MTKRTTRNHSGSVKAKVALAALRGEKTLTEIVQQYEVRPNQVTEWKTYFVRTPGGRTLRPNCAPGVA
jgi:transposase-like protein